MFTKPVSEFPARMKELLFVWDDKKCQSAKFFTILYQTEVIYSYIKQNQVHLN